MIAVRKEFGVFMRFSFPAVYEVCVARTAVAFQKLFNFKLVYVAETWNCD